MAKYSNSVHYSITTSLDASGLTKLQAEIRNVENELQRMANQDLIAPSAAKEAQSQIEKLRNALNKSFNSSLGMLDMTKFNKEIKDSVGSIDNLRTAFATAGRIGDSAFASTAGQLGKLDTQMKSISSTTDKMMNTIGNTVRWGIVASGFAQIMNSAHQAVQYVRDLDQSLTNIMMVTGQSREQMNAYAQTANDVAKALSSTTVAMTDATLVFAQQGFDTSTSTELAKRSTQLANISQQDTAITSDQITTMMNAYNFSGDLEAIDAAMDSWAQVANDSAADVQELATASQKAASTAYTVGLTMDQLNAQIATIESVTREAPENIGNALKTIYSRFADISLGETLEDGVDLGTIAKTLGKVGVNVLDDSGNLRNVGNIMEDLMGVWDTMSSTDQSAISTVIAGRYQLSRFQALMNRSDLYNQYLESSLTAEGTADEMQQIFDESMQGRINKLQATLEGAFNDIFDTSDFYGMIDALTELIDLMNDFVNAVGGGANALTGLGAVATRVFSGSISRGIGNILQNRSLDKLRKENQDAAYGDLIQLGLNPGEKDNKYLDAIRQFAITNHKYESILGDEQKASRNSTLEASVSTYKEMNRLQDEMMKKASIINSIAKERLGEQQELVKIEEKANGLLSVDFSRLDEFVSTSTSDDIERLTKAIEAGDSGAFDKTVKSLTGVVNRLEQVKQNLEEVKKTGDFSKLSNSASVLDMDLRELAESAGVSQDGMQRLRAAYVELESLWDKDNGAAIQNLDAYGAKIQEIIQILTRQNIAINEAQIAGYAKNYRSTRDKLETAQLAMEGQVGIMQASDQGTEKQARINEVVNMTSAVGDLAFAWSSFQSLGSLFANDDISGSEKVNDVLMNLAGTAPMAVMGITQLSESMKTLGIVTNSALPVLAGIGAVLAVASIAIGAYQQHLENVKEIQTEAVTNTANFVSSNQEVVSSFNELYSTYKQTGEVTEEFKSAAQGAAEALNVQGANALIAAGNYDTLADSIAHANDQALQEAIRAEQIQRNGWIEQSLQGDAFNGSAKSDWLDSVHLTETTGMGRFAKTKDTPFRDIALASGYDAASSGDIIDVIRFQKEYVENLNNEINSLNSEIENSSGSTKTELEEEKKAFSEELASAQEFLDQEDVSAFITSLTNEAGYAAQTIQQAIDKTSDTQEIIQAYQNNSSISEYLSLFSDWSDALGWMIQNTTDETQKIALEAEQARYNAAQLAKATTGSDEIADNVYSMLGTSGLSNQDLVSFVGTLDKTTTFDNFAQVIADWKASGNNTITLTADIDTTELQESIENKTNLNSIIEQYSENGNFSEDEVAQLASENPDYLNYLTKVGDVYKLNRNALLDWNSAVEEQTRQIEDAQGKFGSEFFDDYQSDLALQSAKLTDYAAYEEMPEADSMALTGMQNVVESVQNASVALENGKISVQDYFNTYSQAFSANNISAIFGDIESYSSDAQQAILETTEILVNGLSDGVNQANKQLRAGQISLTDYNKLMRKASETALDYSAGLEGLTKQGDDWVQTVDEEGDGIENLSDQQEDWIKVNQDTMDSIDMSEATDGINEALTNNYDYLSTILTEYGNLQVPWDSIVGTQQFTDTVSQMAAGISNFVTSSDSNLALFAASMGMTSDQLITTMGTSQQSIASYMSANEANFTAATQGMMSTGATAIAKIASGAGTAITSLAELVQGFTAKITATPSFGLESHKVSFNILGKEFSFDMPLPKFTIDIEGQATGSTADALSGFSAGLSELGSGLTGLSGLGGAMSDIGLSDWAPGGSGNQAASPSSFTNPGGRGSGGSGGGGGGGGGGSGTKYEPKTKDPIEEEIDRYERVNTMLQAVENDFDRIAEEQDRLVGFDQADNMNEQIELLQRQIALHKEKLAIQKDEAKELRDELSSQYGVTFDSEGFIKNYASTHQKVINRVNNLIDQYNAATTESAQEKLEEQIEKAQDRLDDFNETYQRYDELWSGDLKDTLKSLEDLEDQIEDIRIEAFQTSIDAADNIKDVQTALNEFNQVFSGLDSDDPFRQMALSVSNLKNYFDVATNSVGEFYDELIARTQEQLDMDDLSDSRRKYLEQQIAMMKEAQKVYGDQTMEEYGTGYLDMTMLNLENMLAQIKQWEETGTSSIFGKDSGDMFEVAQDVFDQATSMIEDYEGEIDDLRDAILDAIDEIADEMERRVEAYEAITDELEHQNDIIELLRGENAYEEINKVLAAQQNNYQAQISEMQQQLDIWKDMQEAMEEGSDEWLAIQENITDTQQELNDLVQESLENLQEQYENTVNSITDSWVENAVGTDLDWMSEQWELINRNADYYLDDVNAAYETQKLQGKYLELLDQSNDLHVQQMITEQMKQQLGYLRDKEKLSEYDVAYANAQLEILQKRIALEEAQRNKSQMKLRRDSQGNYSYVYTADEGDVAAAQGDLLDAENNAYNLSKEQMKQTQDDSLSALTDAQQLINDIWTNANLTLEEKKERTQTIIDSLKEYLAGTSEQLSTSETNIINDFIGMVEMMTDENSERLDDVYQQIINGNLDAFDQIDTRWSTSLTEWLYNMEEFNNSTDSMFEGLIDNATDYQDQVDEVGDLVEQDFNDMADSIQNAVDKTNDLSSSTSDFINQLKNDAGVVKDYENTLQEYADKISDVTNEMRAYQDQVNELAGKLTAKEQENANLTAQVGQLKDQIDAYKNGGSGSGSGGGNAQGLKDVKAGSVVGFTGMYYYDSYGQTPAGNNYAGKKRAVKVSAFSASPYGNNSEAPNYGNYKIHIETKSGGHLGWVKPSQLLFDTGGYTGAWSGSGNQDAKDGKLAFLHQKELVLNANDTKNILAAVDIVREITQQMKSGLLGGMLSSMSSASRASQNNATQDVQQEVHITAEFPNANNASEIEQAILSLNERAVQYSFRR